MTHTCRRVLVHGSCVSRDALAVGSQTGMLELAGYYARASLASLSSAPTVDESLLERIQSPFQRRMVRADMDKSFLTAVAEREYDLLVIDLIDERYDLLVTNGGGIVTLSNEYLQASGGRPPAGRTVRSCTASHLARWRCGLERLLGVLDESGRRNRVLINEVYWASTTTDKRPIPGVTLQDVAVANRHLEILYGDLRKHFPTDAFIRYPDDAFVANPDHKWGLSPFHYTDSLYRLTVDAIVGNKPPTPVDLPAPSEPEFAVSVVVDDWEISARIEADPKSLAVEYAFYLMLGKERVGMRWYSDETTARFPLPYAPGDYHIVGFIRDRHTQEVWFKNAHACAVAPVSSLESKEDARPFMDAELIQTEQHDVDFQSGPWTFNFRIYRKASRRAVVFLPNAMAANKRIVPTYPRHSWASDLDANVICVSDPTLYLSESMLGGWFQGKHDDFVLERVLMHLTDLLGKLGVSYNDVVFAGSSMGGWTALMAAARLRGSTAYAENPQLDLREYKVKSAIDNLSKHCFNGQIQAVYEDQPWRFSVLERFKKVDHCPNFWIVQKASDVHHYERHFLPFTRAIATAGLCRGRGITEVIGADDDPTGHTPLSRREAIARISALFDLAMLKAPN